MNEQDGPRRSGAVWFPFTVWEVELVLAVFAFAATCLTFLGLDGRTLAYASLGYVVLAYLAGLLAHARRSPFVFVRDGAVKGEGYARYFRQARKSLLLLHIDDDAPSEELLGLYRTLLARGVEVRRIVFVRPGHAPDAYSWLADFGSHERLRQRVVLPERADLMRVSFVVVDERWSILSVPGSSAVDTERYAARFVLRHLLVVDNSDVAEAFTEAHTQLWRRAVAVDDADVFREPARLSEQLRRSET